MGFEALLGNDQLKENLITSLRKDRASHFYLLCGPEGSGKHTLARLLSAALMCNQPEKPCLHCGPCRKVLAGLHPDCITADEPDKKTVPVSLVRQIREDLFIRPNEGRRKIYLFPRAQDMGAPAQNALLKVLEEPPVYGVFLLLTDNPEKLLPTVRSRCVELALQPLPETVLRPALEQAFPDADPDAVASAMARSGGFLGQAKQLLKAACAVPQQTADFAAACAERDALLLTRTLAPMERWKREDLIPILQQWTQLLEGALACRAGMPAMTTLSARIAAGRSGQELMHAIGCLQKASQYALANVSPAAVCGYLVWALR